MTLRRTNLEELSRVVAGLSGQVHRLTTALAAGDIAPGEALLTAFRLERSAVSLSRRLRALPDQGSPAAARLLAAAEETAALLTQATRKVRTAVAASPATTVKEPVKRGQ